MNIAVLAANGRSGQAFVEAALAAGHTIRAGVHGEHHFAAHVNLTIVNCDATMPIQVRQLIEGTDAVVSLIGHVKGSTAMVQTNAIKVTIAEMKLRGVRRIVSLTGTGVRFDGDEITIMDRILNTSIALIDPARVNDGKQHVEVLKKSDLDWTVLRVLKLQNTNASKFRLSEHGPTKLYVSRKDVARAILEVLENNSFIHEAPILSKV